MITTEVTTRNKTQWDIDLSHSSIRFSVRHLNISWVHGRFDRWTGRLLLDGSGLERSQVGVVIDSSSLNTGDARRDAHLRSSDFFDTDQYPEITFRSTHVEPAGVQMARMTGDLNIARVSRMVTLAVEYLGQADDPWVAARSGYTATTTIDRRDFGLTWSEGLKTGGRLIGEKVKIEISIEAVRRRTGGAAN